MMQARSSTLITSNGSYDAGEEQYAYHLERKYVTIFFRAHQSKTYFLYWQFSMLEDRIQELVLEHDEQADAHRGECCHESGEKLAFLELFRLVTLAGSQEDGEDVEYRNTSGIHQKLYCSEEGIVQLEVNAGCAYQNEKQISGCPEDPFRGDSQYGAHHYEHGEHCKYYQI